VDSRFEAWCDKAWQVHCHWAVVPCPVHVSPECHEQVRTAFPEGGGPDFVRIAARYQPDLAAGFHTGQVAHPLDEPLSGEWHVLWHLGMLYIDTKPHPVPTQERRAVPEPA
jgi:hypothetical protein